MPRKAPTSAQATTFSPPLAEDQHLVQLLAPQGSNSFLSFDPDEKVERLVEISSRLKRIKGLIVTRGDYAIVALYPAGPTDKAQGRLAGEILHILAKGEIKEWRKAGAWPAAFDEPILAPERPASDAEDEDEDEGEGDDGSASVDEED